MLKIIISILMVAFCMSASAEVDMIAPEKQNKQVYHAEIAIIVDDVGNSRRDANVFTLPKAVTLSILPFTPFAKEYALQAEFEQRDVMLHMPMESMHGRALGVGGIISSMNEQAIEQALASALLNVPNAIGVNNHMGSQLTQLYQPMHVTMDYLHKRNLFFVDSRTTKHSQAQQAANEIGLVNARRHVFLDHNPEKAAIEAQFNRLIRLAKRNGRAIAIAHPYQQTVAVLKEKLFLLPQNGIKLVSIREYFKTNQYALVRKEMNVEKEEQQALEEE